VFSNAKNYRRDPHVPLIVPLVNPSHLSIIRQQQSLRSPPLKNGFIVTNANCSTTGCVIPLSALEKAFGPIELLLVTTMQAISGAGYPGISSLDIMDNVIPYISGEEEKMEWETLKILGGITEDDQGVKREALIAFTPDAQTLGCPSAPRHTITVHEEADRPQPRLDRYFQDGAGVSVGRVRQCQVLDIKFVILANNVSIGAATSSIINAELAVLKGFVPS
jgi:aspartate-semialdehyde dehydrogenase